MSSTDPSAARAAVLPRGFYVAVSLLMTVYAVAGFWPSYLAPLLGRTLETLPIIHFHGAVFASWLLLLLVQVAFAATGRVDLHRRFGRFGIVWGSVLLCVGIATAVVRFADRVDAGDLAEAQAWVVWPLLDMVIFAAVFGAAVVVRHQPWLHKRLMIVAATNLLVAPVGRWLELGATPEGAIFAGDSAVDHLVFIGVWTSPILLAIAYDWRCRQALHPIYLGGVLLLAASSFRDHVVPTAPWQTFTQWLATAVA